MGEVYPKDVYRLREERIESCPAEKDLELLFFEKLDTNQQRAFTGWKKPNASWSASKERWPVGKGRRLSPFILSIRGPTRNTASRPAPRPWAFNAKETWSCWSEFRRGHRDDQRADALTAGGLEQDDL